MKKDTQFKGNSLIRYLRFQRELFFNPTFLITIFNPSFLSPFLTHQFTAEDNSCNLSREKNNCLLAGEIFILKDIQSNPEFTSLKIFMRLQVFHGHSKFQSEFCQKYFYFYKNIKTSITHLSFNKLFLLIILQFFISPCFLQV